MNVKSTLYISQNSQKAFFYVCLAKLFGGIQREEGFFVMSIER